MAVRRDEGEDGRVGEGEAQSLGRSPGQGVLRRGGVCGARGARAGKGAGWVFGLLLLEMTGAGLGFQNSDWPNSSPFPTSLLLFRRSTLLDLSTHNQHRANQLVPDPLRACRSTLPVRVSYEPGLG